MRGITTESGLSRECTGIASFAKGGPLALMVYDAYLRTRAEPPGRGSNLSNDDVGMRVEYNSFAQT